MSVTSINPASWMVICRPKCNQPNCYCVPVEYQIHNLDTFQVVVDFIHLKVSFKCFVHSLHFHGSDWIRQYYFYFIPFISKGKAKGKKYFSFSWHLQSTCLSNLLWWQKTAKFNCKVSDHAHIQRNLKAIACSWPKSPEISQLVRNCSCPSKTG